VSQNPPIAFIHIGKTGGTYVKQVIRHNLDAPAKIILPGHIPLAELEATHTSRLRFCFVFRDPMARFVSGFYSRLRMGRPLRKVKWSTQEAVAFNFFPTANALAEALNSSDDRLKSAAIFAMGAIRHVHRGYGFHFGPQIDFTLNALERLQVCVDLEHLDQNLPAFLEKIGIANGRIPPRSDPPVSYDRNLSPLAQENLRNFWHEEFDFYDMFKKLERGFFSA
jgi:hypothetical protein